MKKSFVLIIIITLAALTSCVRTEQKVKYQETFAKAYGYVKYFHPGDEAASINWVRFSYFGAKEIEKCRTKKQLVNTLNKLFNPIAPSVKFSITNNKPDYNLKAITPVQVSDYRLTYWQHQGVSTGMYWKAMPYKSVRVNRGINYEGEQLFSYQPEFGNIITKEIGEGIYCQIPLVLYCNVKNTFPQADSSQFKKMEEDLHKFDSSLDKLSLRLGNIINVYNVFQHFYPYFDVVEVNWDSELEKALTRCYSDKTPKDDLITLQKFTASLKDGHIQINCSLLESFIPSIEWEWIEDQLVITRNYKNNSGFQIGDVVTQINGASPEKYFKEINSLISAGTKGWLNYRAERMSLLGDKGSLLNITINSKSIGLSRVNKPFDYAKEAINLKERYRQIGDSIWYLNLDRIEMDTINKLLPDLEKCKAIICDARGYPKGNHDFMTHLMKSDDTASSWMQVPQIVYPDHQNVTGYLRANWIQRMKAKRPYLGGKKVVYIIDGSAISYMESCMGYIEGYKLATIVGQPTAGTNGNINPFVLPGGYWITWTGMKVLKHNGTQHHGIGILPDVYVTKTIKGIKEGRDEFLEKAIEIVKE